MAPYAIISYNALLDISMFPKPMAKQNVDMVTNMKY